jgi:hypothetical protein
MTLEPVTPDMGDRDPDAQWDARRLWEAQERLAEVEVQLAESLERDRIRALELAALRRDLDVKGAYNDMLERAAGVRDHDLARIQAQLDADRPAAAAIEQLKAELAAERARLSYRVAQRCIPVVLRHRVMAFVVRRACRRLVK